MIFGRTRQKKKILKSKTIPKGNVTKNTFHLLLGIGFFDRERLCNGNWSRIGDDDIVFWLVSGIGVQSFNLTDNIHAFQNFSENDMSTVQPCSLFCCNEKLRSIGVFASICLLELNRLMECFGCLFFFFLFNLFNYHTQPACSVVLELEVLIFEAFAIDWSTYKLIKKKLKPFIF